jgi:Bifunctional DNA primase/polymerase, N-terminal/Primase C terminal 1 (PriCT-1)
VLTVGVMNCVMIITQEYAITYLSNAIRFEIEWRSNWMTEGNLEVQINAPNPTASKSAPGMMQVAFGYAKRGWKLFPVHSPIGPGRCSCGDGKCLKVGKHPRIKGWNTEATIDIDRITKWWTAWPNANIGIITGKASGIWVLDVDDKNDGSQTLQELSDERGELPKTLTSRTGAGHHLYFAHPGYPVKGSVQNIGDGLDVRGDGQYTVAPSSLHANGQVYQWIDANTPLATAPDWLLSIVTADSVADPERESQEVTSMSPDFVIPNWLPEGVRNDSLFRIACYLFSSGMSYDRVELVSLLFNYVKCQPQLLDREIKDLVRSASRYSQEESMSEVADNSSEASVTKKRKRKTKSRAPIFWHKNIPSQNLSDVQLAQLEDYQLGWRSRALDFAFAQGCVLPDDVDQLRKLLRPSNRKKFENEWHIAMYDFQEIELDGQKYLYHPVLFTEYIEAAGQALINKVNGGKRSGQEKVATPPQNGVITSRVESLAA